MRRSSGRKRQDGADIGAQLAGVDHLGDAAKACCGDVDQEEHRLNAMLSGQNFIRLRHRRNQNTARPQHRDGPRLRLATNEIDDGIDGVRLVLEALSAEVDQVIRAEAAHVGGIGPARGGFHARLERAT